MSKFYLYSNGYFGAFLFIAILDTLHNQMNIYCTEWYIQDVEELIVQEWGVTGCARRWNKRKGFDSQFY